MRAKRRGAEGRAARPIKHSGATVESCVGINRGGIPRSRRIGPFMQFAQLGERFQTHWWTYLHSGAR